MAFMKINQICMQAQLPNISAMLEMNLLLDLTGPTLSIVVKFIKILNQ